MGDRPILTFAIAVTPARTLAIWRFRCAMLSATLRSIYHQTDGDFRVVLAGDRRPDIDFPIDDRLEFIQVKSKSSSTRKQSYRDLSNKLRIIATRFAEAGGGCLMPLDMDDFVSNHLVAFVRTHPGPNGYLIERGYGLDARSNTVAPVIHPGGAFGPLHKVCGSSAILNLTPRDVLGRGSSRYARLRRDGHYMVAEEATLEGRPLMPVPFRAVIYVLNHGGNLSDTWDSEAAISQRRRFLDAINQFGRPSSELTAEFSVPALYTCTDDDGSAPVVAMPPLRGSDPRPPVGFRRILASLKSRLRQPR